MERFIREIKAFLESYHLKVNKVRSGLGFESISLNLSPHDSLHTLLLVGIIAESIEESSSQEAAIQVEIGQICSDTGHYPLIVTEDRWRRQGDMMRARILSHLQLFTQIYARNCELRRIDRSIAREFLNANHSYGDAACRYCYGLFLKRHTGHNAILSDPADATAIPDRHSAGDLIAVATFSNARKWIKGDKVIRSYEWTRYASLPGVRLSGGMGKALKAFIEDVQPDDIMTYADLEWSEGSVYERLGFTLEGSRPAVSFIIDPSDWSRIPLSSEATAGVDMPPPARGRKRSANGPADLCSAQPAEAGAEGQTGVNGSCASEDMPTPASKIFQNFGSNKYRLKLTDYQ